MKKILLMVIALALLLGGCGNRNPEGPRISREKIALEKACDDYEKLRSLTLEGIVDLNAVSENGEYTFEMYEYLVVDYDDDVAFEYAEYGDYKSRTWAKDNIMYVDDGHTRSQEPLDDTINDLGFGEMLRKIVDNAEEIRTEEDEGDTVYAITVNDGIIDAYLEFFGAQRNSKTATDSEKEAYIVLDEDGNFKSISMKVYMTWDGVEYTSTYDFFLENPNSSEIPDFDPELFDGSEYSEEPDRLLALDFEDIDKIVCLEYGDDSRYTIYLYEEDGEFDILNENYTEVFGTGTFYYKESTEAMIAESRDESSYRIIEEKKLPDCTAVITECVEFTDWLDKGDVVIIISFDRIDLGILIEGYHDAEIMKTVLDELSIYLQDK